MGKFKSIGIFFLLAMFFTRASNPIFAKENMGYYREGNVLSIRTGKNYWVRYRWRDVPFKPYVQELFSPQGVNVLRDAPSDHLHHHALMYAVAVDGVNFWEEQKAPGRQVHLDHLAVGTGSSSSGPVVYFTDQVDWINPRSQELLLKESRTIRVLSRENLNATVLCWQPRFTVPSGKESVTLSGSHYFGLGMRFLESMDTGGEFRNSEGKTGELVRGTERITRADWCAYTAKANGKVVTVAMFGHPDNLRHPTHWFTMTKPFAYLSATLNLYREPLKILADKPLELQYAVVVWDNRIDSEQVQKVYDWWVKQEF